MLDSVADDEYKECLLKARFLTGADPGIELFETCFATRKDGVRHYSRHVARLKKSAAFWVSRSTNGRSMRKSAEHCATFDAGKPYRLRIALDKHGRIAITSAPLAPLPSDTVRAVAVRYRGCADRVRASAASEQSRRTIRSEA